jgi:hypothetical protein
MTTLQSATDTLFDHYAQAAGASRDLFNDPLGASISRSDLEALVTNPDPNIPQELRDAAQFLLDSDASRNFLDADATGGGVDGAISRDDLQAAMDKIASGDYYGELVGSAGGNEDPWLLPPSLEFASQADIEAALLDPAVPEFVKDTLRLATLSGDAGSTPGFSLPQMSADDYRAAAALYNSAEFKALSETDQKLVAEAFRDAHGDPAVIADLRKQIADPSFQALDAAGKTAKLTEFVLLRSPEFKALSSSDQQLVRDALAAREPGDTSLPANIKHLVESENFDKLGAAEKTAVLSQVKNYPESDVAANIERMLAKDWFKDQSFEDKQRSLKVIAQMSADDGGDRTILDNTLNRLLDPDSDYALKWEDKAPDSNGNITFGWNPNDSHDVYLNSRLMSADNGPVDGNDENSLGLDTLPHEISHAINDDETDQTFDYLNQEYRAWYVGFQAEHGRPPSNEEAMERWEYFLNPDGGYAEYAHGIERDWWFDTDGALDKSEEAEQIFQLLSDLTGLEVNADNYRDVLAMDPDDWNTDPGAPAATRWPSDDDLDN